MGVRLECMFWLKIVCEWSPWFFIFFVLYLKRTQHQSFFFPTADSGLVAWWLGGVISSKIQRLDVKTKNCDQTLYEQEPTKAPGTETRGWWNYLVLPPVASINESSFCPFADSPIQFLSRWNLCSQKHSFFSISLNRLWFIDQHLHLVALTVNCM